MDIIQYNPFQLRWLMCIEILYIRLCSFFPIEILKSMKWYVGKSMIYDDINNTLRDKYFYRHWGLDCIHMFTEYLKLQYSEDTQHQLPYKGGMTHVLNTM